ncbi:MAG: glucosaminidase domain-containing protein [Clostridium sp.]|nr:glucosaminidase domain-containing protein [Clostridium sp.]
MKRLATIVLLFVALISGIAPLSATTPIVGDPELDVDHMVRYIRQHNSDFPREIAEVYYAVGERYGIRGDIALCQAIIETGWFTFCGGTAVTLEQNNFCGLGVTKLGVRGLEFETIEEGVTAQIQHLYAYACKRPVPAGEQILDPRFSLVTRGSAPTWEKLSGRWAANRNYGRDILRVYTQACDYKPEKPRQENRRYIQTPSGETVATAFFD